MRFRPVPCLLVFLPGALCAFWACQGATTHGSQSEPVATGGVAAGCDGSEGDEACPCYGNETCNGQLVCLSSVCVDASSLGSGGVVGSGRETATGGRGSAGGNTGGALGSDDGSTNSDGGGSAGGNTGGALGSDGGSTNSGGTSFVEVPLVPQDGWVDGASNSLGIQGPMFTSSDDTTAATVSEDFTGSNACIAGAAAQVNLDCTPNPPAADCYSEFWGAAVGMNLNVSIDPSTMQGADPAPFDATSVEGFTFELSGYTVPTSLRFAMLSGSTADRVTGYCSLSSVPLVPGLNRLLLADLRTECWGTTGDAPDAEALASVIRLQWLVVTNEKSTVPFDFCISDLRALVSP